MLVHFRLTVPEDLGDDVRSLLLRDEAVIDVTSQAGVLLDPPGDLIEADVAREQAQEVVHALHRLGLGERGGIVLTEPLGTPYDAAKRLEAAVPGHPDDAVIWGSVEAEAEDGAVPTLSFHVFLVISVALAGVAVVTDSAVLVVGAMVVGPEYSAIAALSAGFALRRWGLIGRSLRLLVASFALAVAVVTVLALVARATGMLEAVDVTRARPSTGFIWHPDRWSVVVALFAGAAGALALAVQRAATMVGVFISVTTVPAAGNLALGIAVWSGSEMRGSAEQLVLNIVCMVVSGSLLLLAVRTVWPWLAARSETLFGSREGAR